MQTNRERFVLFLKDQNWSLAASVSVNSMKTGDQDEIGWHFHTLMKTCNHWRVLRMVKTWLDNDVACDVTQSYSEEFSEKYCWLVPLLFGEHCITEQQRKKREDFRKLHFTPYPILDPLIMWLNQGKNFG